MIKFEEILNEKKKKDVLSHKKRLKMYEDYFKNLSPKDFKVRLKDNVIEIIIPK